MIASRTELVGLLLASVACNHGDGVEAQPPGEPSLTDVRFQSFTAQPEKATVLPGEPLAVEVSLGNESEKPLDLDLGFDQVGAFGFRVTGPDGSSVPTSPPKPRFGLTRSGKVVIPPGESTTRLLVLNVWCSTILPPGEYQVETFLGTSGDQRRSGFSFTVAKRDDGKLAEVLSDLAGEVLDPERPLADRHHSATMLTSSRSPVAVPAIARILSECKDSTVRRKAILGLGRIPAVESVQALSTLALSDGGRTSESKMAAFLVYEVHDSATDAKVRAACEPVMQKIPRPAEPKAID